MSDEEGSGARLAVALREPAPAVKIASSLQAASRRDVLHVDGKGRVRSPARYRLLQYGWYASMAGVVAGGTALYYTLIGPSSIAVGAALGLWYGHLVRRYWSLRDGIKLLTADRFDEAAASFTRTATARGVPRRLRALAEQNLAACKMIGGQYGEALVLYRSSMGRWRSSRTLHAMLARHGEVIALINLGRLPEARARLDALGPPPDGEFLKINHWTVELYLALAGGANAPGEDELFRRSRIALGITTAAGLLGLLAWAYEQRGDRDMSLHLLQECLDRHVGPRLSGVLPLLQKWLDARATAQ
jgi:hypothetical protein